MEEHILGLLLIGKELDVINNQNVNQLIEMDEIVHLIVLQRVNELVGKLLTGNKQYRFVLVLLLHHISDSLSEVRLTQSYPSVNHQGVECRCSRLIRNSKAC